MLLVGPACDSMRLQSGGWTKHWQVSTDMKHTIMEDDSSREDGRINLEHPGGAGVGGGWDGARGK